MNNETGKWLIVIGALIMITGIVVWLFAGRLHWIGRLPGDIHVERDNFKFYFPITTMVIVSVLLSALLWLARKLF